MNTPESSLTEESLRQAVGDKILNVNRSRHLDNSAGVDDRELSLDDSLAGIALVYVARV
jgi:hypothetical protein